MWESRLAGEDFIHSEIDQPKKLTVVDQTILYNFWRQTRIDLIQLILGLVKGEYKFLHSEKAILNETRPDIIRQKKK